MENTLYAFGDSFSEPIDVLTELSPNNDRTKYARNYLNSDSFPIWAELLANNLNYNYENYSAIAGVDLDILQKGNSNYHILYNLNEKCHEFKKNDIVIVGFTTITRFPIPLENTGVVTKLVSMEHDNFDKKENDLYDLLAYKRSRFSFYKEELLQLLKPIEILSDSIGFHLYYWSWVDDVLNYKFEEKLLDRRWIVPQRLNKEDIDYRFIQHLELYGKPKIIDETNGDIDDHHLGKVGNEIQYKIFLEYIKKDLGI